MRTLRHGIKPRLAYIAVLLPFEPKFRTTGKTNAERQKEYRERKKLKDPKLLDKERKQQKNYYVLVKKLSRKEYEKQKEEVRSASLISMSERHQYRSP